MRGLVGKLVSYRKDIVHLSTAGIQLVHLLNPAKVPLVDGCTSPATLSLHKVDRDSVEEPHLLQAVTLGSCGPLAHLHM